MNGETIQTSGKQCTGYMAGSLQSTILYFNSTTRWKYISSGSLLLYPKFCTPYSKRSPICKPLLIR